MKQTTLTFMGNNGYRMWIEWTEDAFEKNSMDNSGGYPFTRERVVDKMEEYGYTLLEMWEIFRGEQK